jgi:membrane-bound lytic murein transglycosylase D
MFGDWHLALAAYNWGQGNVQRAIDRNRRAGLPTDYLSLPMPQETREYGPKLQAVKNIVMRPQAFGLSLPPFQNHPFFLSVAIVRDIDVALAARLSGLPLEEFLQLNPQMNKPVILAAGTPRVLLPYDNANRFVQELSVHRGQFASWTAWVAPKTLKAQEAARLTGMPEAQLREVNHIPPRMLVKVGSTLVVPRSAQTATDVSVAVADNAMMALAPEERPLRKVSFKAGRKGDSVAAVALRYKVSAAQVAQWNGVSAQGRFKAGQAVVVMVPAQARKLVRGAGQTTQLARGAGQKRPGPPTARARVGQAIGPR